MTYQIKQDDDRESEGNFSLIIPVRLFDLVDPCSSILLVGLSFINQNILGFFSVSDGCITITHAKNDLTFASI